MTQRLGWQRLRPQRRVRDRSASLPAAPPGSPPPASAIADRVPCPSASQRCTYSCAIPAMLTRRIAGRSSLEQARTVPRTASAFAGNAPLAAAPTASSALGQDPQRHREIGPERVGALRRQRATDLHRLARRRQRRLPIAKRAQTDPQIVQRHREIGPERVGALRRQRATDLHRLARRRQRRLRSPSSLRKVARLFSDTARSGRVASGRCAAKAR